MNPNNTKYLVGAACMVVAFFIAFFWTQKFNRDNASASVASPTGAPAGSPGGAGNQQAMMAQIQQIIERAKTNPKDFAAQIEAAQVFAEIDRKKEAVEYLEKAYAVSSGDFAKLDPGAYEFAARYYFELNQYPQAEEWYGRATKAAPQNAGNYVMLAETFVQRQPPQPDRAIDYIQQALRLDPKNAHALGHLVEAYALKKDARSAEDALNRLKDSNASSDRVSKLQAMVADLKAGKPVSIPKE